MAQAISNRRLGLILALLMLTLLAGAMIFRKWGGHDPIVPVPSATMPRE